jgi:ADP-ribose pyrophosphatase YjhB (NUDIX family)
MRRTERAGDPWSGHWSCPGGRRDPCDSDLLCTALRELSEECGIALHASDLVTDLPPRLARRATGPYLLVAPFVLRTQCRPGIVLDQGEAVEAVWVPLTTLRDSRNHRLQMVPGRPPDMRFPAIALGPTPLWGFTYRLLTDWLGILPMAPLEEAGWSVANAVLRFALSEGLTLKQPWTKRLVFDAAAGGTTVNEAHFAGRFPAAALLQHFCQAGQHIEAVNLLQVRGDLVRIVGAAFEQYELRASED